MGIEKKPKQRHNYKLHQLLKLEQHHQPENKKKGKKNTIYAS